MLLLLQSLRQVLTELRCLSDAQSPCSTATSAKPIRLVPFPSEPRSGSSPLLQSDEQLLRHSPKARAAPFWGPGLTPADPASVPSNSPQSQSILSRLQRLCSGERNLRTTASRDNDEASSSSNSSSSGSKLWHFDICMSEDVLRSMFYKRLCWRLGACSAKESLIAEAVQASSTGMVLFDTTDWHSSTIPLCLTLFIKLKTMTLQNKLPFVARSFWTCYCTQMRSCWADLTQKVVLAFKMLTAPCQVL